MATFIRFKHTVCTCAATVGTMSPLCEMCIDHHDDRIRELLTELVIVGASEWNLILSGASRL